MRRSVAATNGAPSAGTLQPLVTAWVAISLTGEFSLLEAYCVQFNVYSLKFDIVNEFDTLGTNIIKLSDIFKYIYIYIYI